MLSPYGNRKQQEPFPPAGLLPTRDKKFPVLESDRPVGNVLDGPWTDGPMGLRAALLWVARFLTWHSLLSVLPHINPILTVLTPELLSSATRTIMNCSSLMI